MCATAVPTTVVTRSHVGAWDGLTALAWCAVRTGDLVARRRIHQPRAASGRRVGWADGTTSRVYRETVADHDAKEPCTLVVRFRLRRVRSPVLHTLFRLESELNTVLFAGFEGFVSKLWFADDEHGVYRGLYDWDGPDAAEAYVRALWWALMVVGERSSIEAVVVPGVRRDQLLADARAVDVADPTAWWRPVAISRP